MSRMPKKSLLAIGLLACTAALAAPIEGRPSRGIGTRRLESGAPIRPTRSYRQELRSSAAVSLADVKLPHLQYYGGKVIENVRMIPVLWASADPGFKTRLDAFYKTFATCEQFDYLPEFNTIGTIDGHPGTNQSIGKGTADPSVIITPSVSSNALSEPNVIDELKRQLSSGGLPANDENTLYMVHLPPGYSLRDPGFTSCSDYCAFHDSFDRSGVQVRFALIPDHSTGGCSTGCGEDKTDFFNNMSASVSHEVMEAVTDPDVGAGNFPCGGPAWCDPQDADQATSHSENGDICASSVADQHAGPFNITEGAITGADGNPIVVQREWSNKHAACITTPRQAFSLLIDPPAQRIAGAGSYTFKVRTTVPAAGVAPVTLGTFNLPSGISATFSPSTGITTGGEVTMTLTVTQLSSAAINFAVWAEGPGNQAMAVGSLGSDDFTIVAGPTVELAAGGTASAVLNTSQVPGSANQTLSVALTGKPPGVTIQGSAPTATAGQPLVIPLIASPGTPSSTTSSLTFTLSNGITTHTVTVPLVLAGDDFTATEDAPPQLIVSKGGTAQFHVITATAAGQPQKLTFSAAQLPPNVTASFSPASVMSGGSTVVTVKANNAPSGTGTLVINVAGPNIATDVAVSTLVQSGGCSAAGGSGWALAAALGLAGLWLRRRRPAQL